MTAGIKRYNRPTRGYTTVDNTFARSKYTPRAVKVGLYVLSHTDGYVLTQEAIGRAIGVSSKTVMEALRDLEGYGLLVRFEERDARGFRSGTLIHISDTPFTDEERSDLRKQVLGEESGARGRGLTPEIPGEESGGHKKTNSNQKTNQDSSSPALFDVDDKGSSGRPRVESTWIPAFDAFWSAYPKKIDKKAAQREYLRILKADEAKVRELHEGAERYAASRRGEDPKYTKGPAAWLRAGKWLDELPPVRQAAPVKDTNWEADVD